MSVDAPKEHKSNYLMLSVAVGLLAGTGLFLTLSTLGLPRLEAMVFASLGGLTLGAFVCRERVLMSSNERLTKQHAAEITLLEKRIHYYYTSSLACLVYFDAGTLLIQRASPGFLQMLRVPPELKLGGKSIVDLLRVSPSRMEAIISGAQRGGAVSNVHQLVVEDSHGRQLPVELTAEYFKETHMVEAAFFVSPFYGKEDAEEADLARKDLDRFRRGMYRRETRILELKEEINEILKAEGKEPRYRFDQKTQDTHVPIAKYLDKQEGRGE